MKFLLAAINAKYIHSNLGLYSIKQYAEKKLQLEETGACQPVSDCNIQIDMGEYTINQQMETILQDLYRRKPDFVGFSCYIWNIVYVMALIKDIKKIMPKAKLWLGGPEVSHCAETVLKENPEIDGIMTGEGEESFYQLVRSYADKTPFHLIPGLVYRNEKGGVAVNQKNQLMDLSDIPFPYGDLREFEHRIIYYESSRGCPFSCSYCLSSIDKAVRFRDLSMVKRELEFFLEQRVPQVKFVDRTFNCKKSHAMEIWSYILEHDNGVTNFHFEISADLLGEEELMLMKQMRPGLIQLEIGVQTTNPDTIREIRRTMDLEKLSAVVKWINGFQNIHQHLDLIAGLPYEGYESFKRSFNDVYAMEPEQLQLGFLKVLKGSHMEKMAESYGLRFQSRPPYEVLSTKWLDYGELVRLKGVEEMVELHYNSGQFLNTIKALEQEFDSPFDFYDALAIYYRSEGLDGISHNRLKRYEILYDFINRLEQVYLLEKKRPLKTKREVYRDLLMYDLYLRENLKSRPSFARDQSPYKEILRRFFMEEAKAPVYLPGYEVYDSRQLSKMAHIEVMGDGTRILFDYKNRDALRGNARTVKLN